MNQLNDLVKFNQRQKRLKSQTKVIKADYDKNTMINENLKQATYRNSVLYNANPNLILINTEKEFKNYDKDNQNYESLSSKNLGSIAKLGNYNTNKKSAESGMTQRTASVDTKTPNARSTGGKSLFESIGSSTRITNKKSVDLISRASTGNLKSAGFGRKSLTSGVFSNKEKSDKTTAGGIFTNNEAHAKIEEDYIITDGGEKEKNLITTKNMFYKHEKTEKSNETRDNQTQIQKPSIVDKKKYLNELFNDNFMKSSQKEIDLELESLGIGVKSSNM